MTLEELNRHFALRERLAKTKDMLDALRATAFPGAQVLTGMPHASTVSDKVGDLAVEIADLETSVSDLEKKCEASQTSIVSFVESIENNYVRTIIRLRFLYALQWKEVAALVGDRSSAHSVKSACYRYLKDCNTMPHGNRDDAP